MAYKVLEYSAENLKRCFSDQAEAHDEIIFSKRHLACFEDYFAHIQIATIIVEEDYVNRDFLEDYSSYYVRSFKEYKRDCIRLHFFKNEITSDDFSNILKGGEGSEILTEQLQLNYRGFMVLKPLPTTIIGKTCISTYDHDGRRYFPSIRTYKANLYGIPLEVKSLAYQEQDSIVAACASSSIWSAFQRTAVLFQHSLPSPVEITNWATKYFPFANRHFPNKGLTGEQMAIAIREVGLEPFLYNVRDYDRLKASTYAYLKGGIPVVLGFDLWDLSDDVPRQRGKHAVTITGYSVGGDVTNSYDVVEELQLTSSRIDKLYVHDDQIGPFARMVFGGSKIMTRRGECLGLDTSWLDGNNHEDNIKATPDILIIPLYHKIRIPFETVLASVNLFNSLFILVAEKVPNFNLFEWDIYLSDIRDFKNDILSDDKLCPDEKEFILTAKYPKYLWRASGKIGDECKLEFIIDATDIEQGSSFLSRISYDKIVEKQYKVLLHGFDSNIVSDLTVKEMIESF
ncbi:hypothetical protein [Mangrovimonas xylaniphaga]|uniref:hypothetical protein n=1 Tax=Mangrovimonas xylaniphaga TaxID=1645915 RepID=UPI0006B53D2A|nr:hypothetical protein [Mangrovimonas xylaniphaga]